MGNSWLDDVMVSVALHVLCRQYSSWGMAESVTLVLKNAAVKAFKRLMKAHLEFSTCDFVLPIHNDKHWVLFHLNLPSHQMICYDSLGGDEDELGELYRRLWDLIKPVAPYPDRPFEFQVAQHTKSGWLSQLPQSQRPDGILNPLVYIFGARSVRSEDVPCDGADSGSEGSESHSSEGSLDMEENQSDNEPFSAVDVDIPAMRRANERRNWAQFNVPAEQPMGGGAHRDEAHPNLLRVRDEHCTTGEGPPQQDTIVTSSLSGRPMARRDWINLYISLEGCDGEERPHIEYDISVSKVSIGEVLMQILTKGGRIVRALKQMDHSQLTVSTSTRPLCRRKGGGDDLSFQEIASLDQVLSQDSSHYNTPLRSCRECTETSTVVQETELERSNLYVIYVHRASDMAIPLASGATLGAGAPAAAIPDWQMWDSMFLPTICCLSPLFDQSYNEPFKIYLAVHLVMAIAENITSDKKALTMGADRQLPGVLDWLSTRVGTHGLDIFSRKPKTFGQYVTFWRRVQSVAGELSQAKLDEDRAQMLQMLCTWQNLPLRADTLESEPLTPQELHHLNWAVSRVTFNPGQYPSKFHFHLASQSLQGRHPPLLRSRGGDDERLRIPWVLVWLNGSLYTMICSMLQRFLTTTRTQIPKSNSFAKYGRQSWYIGAPASLHQTSDSIVKSPDVGRVVFLLPIDNWMGGCIINIDFELSEVLEFMGELKTDNLREFLMALEDFDRTDYLDFEEIHLAHNWFHTEVLSAINGSESGLLEGELLDEAEILLGQGGDSKATTSA
ncbi:hypothetical protein EDD85DRAFT_789743 [Armillaria nabsnona]|nr:hypothetical protein EDD85DRAFT_789743 [Armillaria nabsnona]